MLPLCLALTALWAAPTHANTIDLANNLIQTPLGFSRIGSSEWTAQAFTTDATHTRVTDVTTLLRRLGTGSLNLSIYSTATGNKPGSFVAAVGSFDIASQLSNTLEEKLFSGLAISLSANTQYFLVLGVSGATGNQAGWGFTSSISGTGFLFYYSFSSSSGTTWTDENLNTPQIMRIQAASTSDIPEPASLGLLATGSVGWSFTRRRVASPVD